MIDPSSRAETAPIQHEPPPPPPPPPRPPADAGHQHDGVDGVPGHSGDHMFAPAPASDHPPTPAEALQQIQDLEPYVDSVGRQSGKGNELYSAQLPEYNRKRAEIADKALASARPPRPEDYGSNHQDYNLDRQEYDRQIADLKRISAEAKAFPTQSPQHAHELYQKVQSIKEHAATARTDPAAAKQVAEDIASLKGEPQALDLAFKEAFAGKSADEVNEIIGKVVGAGVSGGEAVNNPLNESGITQYANYDTTLTGQVLDAVATSSDPTVKANFFRAGSATFSPGPAGGFEGPSDANVRNGLSNIINSDTNGVVGELVDLDPDGKALTSYMQGELDNGGDARVKDVIAREVYGNDLNGNHPTSGAAFARIDTDADPSDRELYKNARDLGYVVGSVGAAIDKVAEGAEDAADQAKNFFGAAAGVAGSFGPEAGVPAALGGLGANAIINDALKSERDGLKDRYDRFADTALPRDGHGKVYSGAAREIFYENADHVRGASHLPG